MAFYLISSSSNLNCCVKRVSLSFNREHMTFLMRNGIHLVGFKTQIRKWLQGIQQKCGNP